MKLFPTQITAVTFWFLGNCAESIKVVVVTNSDDAKELGPCQGDCDHDGHCQRGLVCFQRDAYEAVPGCIGGETDTSRTDYCTVSASVPTKLPTSPTPTPPPTSNSQPMKTRTIPPKKSSETPLVNLGASPPNDRLPLGRCEGDCDHDGQCNTGLVCFQRDSGDPVPGCYGIDATRTDYCIDPTVLITHVNVSREGNEMEYIPGKLTTHKVGLLLSQGLDAMLIAETGQFVEYHNGTRSSIPFHGRPDAGATFADTRPGNEGGFVYVSNSEMQLQGEGGVGALTFDTNGKIIDYQMLLTGTTMNCGGGRSPWKSWITCEEKEDRTGNAFQVDPFGIRTPEKLTMGNEGGSWESFVYDYRLVNAPRFFMTEDHLFGALARFSPATMNWTDPWTMLHGEGRKDYLRLYPNWTFAWIENRTEAMTNARVYYPESEGIDVRGSELLFVSKRLRMLYILNLDTHTWTQSSTVSGLFEGEPDQLQRLFENPRNLLYFTEEGDKNAGVHARDEEARFYTILESSLYPGESTGLAFSPDARFLFVAYQDVGKLFLVWRLDGGVFGAEHLDVKYHTPSSG